jgi:hypothetical protein
MATVDELRDAIRERVGRHARIESTAFTKEALAAVCEAVDADVDVSGATPPKAEMRAAILRAVGADADADATADDADSPLRKAQLRAVADALGIDDDGS